MKRQGIFLLEPGRLDVREIDVPDPADDEVQVAMLANGICMGEVVQWTGVLDLPGPRILGHEGITRVEKVGDDVSDLAEGDLVTLWNDPRFEDGIGLPWVTHANLPARRVVKYRLPVGDPAVMFAEPAACVATALYTYDVVPGDRVLLVGAGYMGLLNVQGLAHYPLSELVVVEPQEGNRRLAERFGATETIDPSTATGKARLDELAQEPFDLVVEAAGVEAALRIAERMVAPGKRLSVFAWHHEHRGLDMDRLHMAGITLVNSSPWSGKDHNVDKLDRGVRMLEQGILDQRELVTHRWGFREAVEALTTAVDRPEGYVKGVLTF